MLIYMTWLINIVLTYFVSWIYNHNVQCNLRISFENLFPKNCKMWRQLCPYRWREQYMYVLMPKKGCIWKRRMGSAHFVLYIAQFVKIRTIIFACGKTTFQYWLYYMSHFDTIKNSSRWLLKIFDRQKSWTNRFL